MAAFFIEVSKKQAKSNQNLDFMEEDEKSIPFVFR